MRKLPFLAVLLVMLFPACQPEQEPVADPVYPSTLVGLWEGEKEYFGLGVRINIKSDNPDASNRPNAQLLIRYSDDTEKDYRLRITYDPQTGEGYAVNYDSTSNGTFLGIEADRIHGKVYALGMLVYDGEMARVSATPLDFNY